MTTSEILETLQNLQYPEHTEISYRIYWKLYPKQMQEIMEEISNREKNNLVESEN